GGVVRARGGGDPLGRLVGAGRRLRRLLRPTRCTEWAVIVEVVATAPVGTVVSCHVAYPIKSLRMRVNPACTRPIVVGSGVASCGSCTAAAASTAGSPSVTTVNTRSPDCQVATVAAT